MFQMKEQKNISEKELNKIKMSHLPEAKLNTLVVRILTELRENVEKLSENFNK